MGLLMFLQYYKCIAASTIAISAVVALAGALGRSCASPTDRPDAESATRHLTEDTTITLEQFRVLTATAWTRCVDDVMAESCVTIELRANGTYRWLAKSDVVERNEHGLWNWRSTGDRSGMLLLSESGVLSVTLVGDELVLPHLGRLVAGDKLDMQGHPGLLKTVDPPALFAKLINGPWFKANDFDSFMLPDRMEFYSGGRVAFSYRGGECDHDAIWSLYKLSGSGEKWFLFAEAALNQCDVRYSEPRTGTFSSPIEFQNGTMSLHQPYRRAQSSEHQLVDLDDGRWHATGTLSGKLVNEEAVMLDLNITSKLSRDVKVGRAVVSLQPLERTGEGFGYVGESQILATVDLDNSTITPHGSFSIRVSLTPSVVAEWAQLRIELEAEVPMSTRVVTEVRPGPRPQ